MRKMTKTINPKKMRVAELNDTHEAVSIPSEWSLVSAFDYIYELSEDSELSDLFWENARPALDYLQNRMNLSDVQLVVLAIILESDSKMGYRNFADHLGFTRLKMMTYSEEVEKMVSEGWLMRKQLPTMDGSRAGFCIPDGFVQSLSRDEAYKPEDLSNLTLQQFVDRITDHVDHFLQDRNNRIEDDVDWYKRLIISNPNLELCRRINRLDNIYEKIFFMIILANYSLYAGSKKEGVGIGLISKAFPDCMEVNVMQSMLLEESHPLIMNKFIDFRNEDGIVNTEAFLLHRNMKDTFLSEFKPCRRLCRKGKTDHRLLQSHSDIHAKTLFYNHSEQSQIERLHRLLDTDNFVGVQSRLEEKGFRKGFACLFYGSPGTGKTETVLQLARNTGRDIMKVDISEMKDKWVGESEKNIKAVFTQYKELCKNCEVQPILFFNEADAIFGTRFEEAQYSVDKLNNVIQNIILQEIEEFEGILIATTNLTGSLDPAFERRFLFKIEFKRPGLEAKRKIWESMLGGEISSDDAKILASEFDFSGGQIENVVRKQTVDYILDGTETSLESLHRYCKEELIKFNSRKSIGFAL